MGRVAGVDAIRRRAECSPCLVVSCTIVPFDDIHVLNPHLDSSIYLRNATRTYIEKVSALDTDCEEDLAQMMKILHCRWKETMSAQKISLRRPDGLYPFHHHRTEVNKGVTLY